MVTEIILTEKDDCEIFLIATGNTEDNSDCNDATEVKMVDIH